MKDEFKPFKIVFDKIFEVTKVIITPKIITEVKIKADFKELKNPSVSPMKNIDIMEISKGNLPLQGTKLLVKIAINLSLGESIILQPVTPQALQPKPMHIVRDCFPCAPHFLKALSRLNAILGKYPTSSIKVKSGKKMAIGGSMTETTQAKVL